MVIYNTTQSKISLASYMHAKYGKPVLKTPVSSQPFCVSQYAHLCSKFLSAHFFCAHAFTLSNSKWTGRHHTYKHQPQKKKLTHSNTYGTYCWRGAHTHTPVNPALPTAGEEYTHSSQSSPTYCWRRAHTHSSQSSDTYGCYSQSTHTLWLAHTRESTRKHKHKHEHKHKRSSTVHICTL